MQTPILSGDISGTIRALDNDDMLLTGRQVREACGGVSDMAIWRWMRDPRVLFPKPFMKMNRRNYWRLRDIRGWKAVQAAKTADQQAAA